MNIEVIPPYKLAWL